MTNRWSSRFTTPLLAIRPSNSTAYRQLLGRTATHGLQQRRFVGRRIGIDAGDGPHIVERLIPDLFPDHTKHRWGLSPMDVGRKNRVEHEPDDVGVLRERRFRQHQRQER